MLGYMNHLLWSVDSVPSSFPSINEALAGELSHRGALAHLEDAQAGDFVELNFDVFQELHGAFYADAIGVLLGVIWEV